MRKLIHPFALACRRRFGPLLGTQFAGALNDNVLKAGLIVLAAYSVGGKANAPVNLASALYLLPFLLLSPLAGQLADKYDKALLIRRIKLAEVAIMAAAATLIALRAEAGLMAALFLVGAQSAFFGPLKFSILPQHLHRPELIAGNAMVEAGTFLAIMIGTTIGSVLAGMAPSGLPLTAAVLVGTALLGLALSHLVPAAPPPSPELRINWNPLSAGWEQLRIIHRERTVFLSALGIAWFWFVGATYITQLAGYAQLALGGNEQVVWLLLLTFSVGIALGSLLCERAAGGRVELGLVPLGSIGITVFSLHLFAAVDPLRVAAPLDIAAFLETQGSGRVLVDLLGIGASAGLYIVPLLALVQQRSDPAQRGRVIAGNNLLNAAAIVIAVLLAMGLLAAGLNTGQVFLVVAVMNAAVAVYIYSTVPEFLLRCVAWLLSHTLYRISKAGLHHVPGEGPAVLVCNHVAYSDPVVIAGAVRRPVRFVMDHNIFRAPVLGYFFRTMRTIPIAPSKVDPQLLEQAYEAVSDALKNGELVCIFPEGSLTRTGEIAEFKKGIERIIARDPVPVVPMALQGLWGSVFSRKYGPPAASLPRRFWSRINLLVGPAIPAAEVTAEGLRDIVANMRGDHA
ncbi:MAG: MFS transporter [Pseudomonadota bacterium]